MFRLRQSFSDAVRTHTRHPWFAVAVVMFSGLAVAVSSIAFSVLDSMLSPNTSIGQPDRLVQVQFFGDAKRQIPQLEKNIAIRALSSASDVAAYRFVVDNRFVERGGKTFEGRVKLVSPNYFRTLVVRPTKGRLPITVGNGERLLALSDRFYEELFSHSETLERAIVYMRGEAWRVVATLPYTADFPGHNTDVWLIADPSVETAMTPSLVRLRGAATVTSLSVELDLIRKRFAAVTGEDESEASFHIRNAFERPLRTLGFHVAVFIGALAVLIVAGLNVANLLVARTLARSGEFGTRLALGAMPNDLALLVATETALLGVGALVLGAIETLWAVGILDANLPSGLALTIARPQVSWRVWAFSLAVTLLFVGLASFLPAALPRRVSVRQALQGVALGGDGSPWRRYGPMLALQNALGVVVVAMAALLIIAARIVDNYSPGYPTRGLLMTTIAFSQNEWRSRTKAESALLSAVSSVKGVTAASVLQTGFPRTRALAVVSATSTRDIPVYRWGYKVVSHTYFGTIQLPVVRGRAFVEGDVGLPLAIVDRRTAARLWPSEEPIGQALKLDSMRASTPWYRVIGVAGDVDDWLMRGESMPEPEATAGLGEVYIVTPPQELTLGVAPAPNVFLLVMRAEAEDTPLMLHRKLASMTPRFLAFPKTWEEGANLRSVQASRWFMATLFATCAMLAIALASFGTFSVAQQSVQRRRFEFAVRIALGARPSDVAALVARDIARVTIVGALGGVAAAYFAAGWLRLFLFSDTARDDVRPYGAALALVVASAAVAAVAPLIRAARTRPDGALRST